MGSALSSGDPFATSLDPGFDRSDAGRVSSGAGWYDSDPFNGQGGVTLPELRVLVGRFVIAAPDVAGNRFTATGILSDNRGYPGVEFATSSIVVDLPDTVVPVPVTALGFAGIGLFRTRRR